MAEQGSKGMRRKIRKSPKQNKKKVFSKLIWERRG